MNTVNQAEQILDYLKGGHSLTALKCVRLFGCMRLAARVNELRSTGHNIKTEMVKLGGKRVAKYTLEGATS